MSEWKEYSVGEIVKLEYGKGLKDYRDGDSGYDVFGTNGKIGKTENFLYDQPSVIIGRKGAYREVHYAKDPFFVIDTAFYTKNLIDEIDTTFLYYWFKNVDINAMDSGSAIPSTSRDEVYDLEIQLPELPEQTAIANALSSLDDKIDLLHRQNKTLEALAETLFRQWFVEEAEEGWEDGELFDLIEINPRRSLKKHIAAPYLEMKNVSTEIYQPENWYEREFTSGTRFVNGDTLLARITPCLQNGKTAYVDFLNGNEVGWGSTEFIVMRAKSGLHPYFSYILARNEDFRNFAISSMVGSSGRQRADADTILSYEMAIPSKEVIDRFNDYIEPSLNKMKTNHTQIRTLTRLRDTLLPKLMSGEVRVKI